MQRGAGAMLVLTTVAIGLAIAAAAAAIGPAEGLSSAEERIARAEAQIAAAETRLTPALRRYAALARRANRAEGEVETAAGQTEEIEASLVERREAAAERVANANAEYNEAVDEHDSEVENGWGLALAALVAAAITLAWGRFRASAPVTKLAGLSRTKAIGLCVGGGLVLLIFGAGLSSAGGLLGAVGAMIVFLGLVLPVALLLARHSVGVQRGEEGAVFKRDRLPAWVTFGLAAVMLLLFVGGLGSAVFDDAPEEPAIAASLRKEAEHAEDGEPGEPATAELRRAVTKTQRLEEQAAKIAGPRDEARQALGEIRTQLRNGRRLLTRAERTARVFTRRLAAIAARETREAEAEARELEEIEAEELPPIESENYETCDTAPSNIPVPPGSPLDGDGDGIGCES